MSKRRRSDELIPRSDAGEGEGDEEEDKGDRKRPREPVRSIRGATSAGKGEDDEKEDEGENERQCSGDRKKHQVTGTPMIRTGDVPELRRSARQSKQPRLSAEAQKDAEEEEDEEEEEEEGGDVLELRHSAHKARIRLKPTRLELATTSKEQRRQLSVRFGALSEPERKVVSADRYAKSRPAPSDKYFGNIMEFVDSGNVVRMYYVQKRKYARGVYRGEHGGRNIFVSPKKTRLLQSGDHVSAGKRELVVGKEINPKLRPVAEAAFAEGVEAVASNRSARSSSAAFGYVVQFVGSRKMMTARFHSRKGNRGYYVGSLPGIRGQILLNENSLLEIGGLYTAAGKKVKVISTVNPEKQKAAQAMMRAGARAADAGKRASLAAIRLFNAQRGE